MTTRHWVLSVRAVNFQNCTRNVVVGRSDVSEVWILHKYCNDVQSSSSKKHVCLAVSAVSPGCDCHDDQSVDESFVSNCFFFRLDEFGPASTSGGGGGSADGSKAGGGTSTS